MSKTEQLRRLPAALVAWWHKLLSPPPDETVCEWAKRSLTLAESADNGPFSVRRRPYMREPLERHRDPRCRIITLCWGSQMGKTIVVYIGRFFRNRVFGYSALIVLPSINYARRIAKSRILPLLRSSPVMKEIIPPYRHSIQALEQYFSTCYNIITGSNSAANLAGQPVPDQCGDETDKFKEGDDKETCATALIPQRGKTFPYSLLVWTSTPSNPAGFIWGSLHDGDHRRFHFHCPGCGRHHPLEWEQFRKPEDARKSNGKWDLERVENETWHECPHGCGYRFTEADKHRAYAADYAAHEANPERRWIFKSAEDHAAEVARIGPEEFRRQVPVFWLPTNEDAPPSHHSYHGPSWISPDSKCSFGAIQVQWLIALNSGDVQKIQDFYNQTRAEAFDIVAFGITAITDLPKGSYELGDTWEEAMIHLTDNKPVRVLVFDRQQASFWGICRTIGQDGSTRLFWEGELPDFNACDEMARKLGAQTVICDVGYKMKETADECLNRGWVAMWGDPHAKDGYITREPPSAEHPSGRAVTVSYRWASYTTATGRKCPVVRWATQAGQAQLAAMIGGKVGAKWTICATPSEHYTRQMRSHHLVMKKGRSLFEQRDKEPDHQWDCESMFAIWCEVDGLISFEPVGDK